MATKLIVLGAEGLLGSAVVSLADAVSDMAAVGLDREACDITDLARIKEVCSIIRPSPKFLINCAAYTDVDGAESDEETATRVNVMGAGNVAAAADAIDATVIHISSDYVFDGAARTPYKENAKTRPISVYGKTKLLGEEAVKERCKRHLIIRTGWLYGHGGDCFPSKILERASAGEPLRVVDDQFGSPTFARDLASVILELVRQRRTGTVHAVNRGQTSWYGLATKTLELSEIDTVPQPITSKDLARPAARPTYSVLDTSKLETWIEGGMPPWEDALERFLLGDTNSMEA